MGAYILCTVPVPRRSSILLLRTVPVVHYQTYGTIARTRTVDGCCARYQTLYSTTYCAGTVRYRYWYRTVTVRYRSVGKDAELTGDGGVPPASKANSRRGAGGVSVVFQCTHSSRCFCFSAYVPVWTHSIEESVTNYPQI